jgi:hypothetical protein
MFALIHSPTAARADLPRGKACARPITRRSKATWRRFMDALMTALSAMQV